MKSDELQLLKRLTDDELLSATRSAAGHERQATASLVARLAELDTRDVLLREGYSSLFAYCREALGFSEHAALNRIEAARAARRFPAILGMLEQGGVHLTAVRLLAPHLTVENHVRVLGQARGKRVEEIRALAAAWAPRPAAVTPRAPGTATGPLIVAAETVGASPSPFPGGSPVRAAMSDQPPFPPAVPTPVSAPSPYRRHIALGADTLEKLHLAKQMLRHALPTGDEGVIVDRALSLLLMDLARKKFAATDRPQRSRPARPESRHVPADVRRSVWLRDLGRCAYVGAAGHRCGERSFLEFHHVKPFEAGGEATVENIQLRCGRHNRYEAQVYFRQGRTHGEGLVGECRTVYGRLASRPATRFKTSSNRAGWRTP